MMKKTNNLPELQAHYKLWLSLKNGEGILGDGKWLLLQTINELGSISKAGEKLRISYRKAWGDLRTIELLLGISILEKTRGGASGGSTILTEKGIQLIKEYARFHEDFEKSFQKSFAKFNENLKKIE